MRGQTTAKRALEVAAAGGHNVLMIGPPGSGKTMLAKRLAGILPPLTFPEALRDDADPQRRRAAGAAAPDCCRQRPFRAPHHTISDAGLHRRRQRHSAARRGEPGAPRRAVSGRAAGVSRATCSSYCASRSRSAGDDCARASMTLSFPASFMLVAAMNPCPCGFYGDTTRECRCTPAIIQRYLGKISGPLLDRIDLHIEVPAVPYKELRAKETGASSAEMRDRVARARAVQQERGHLQRRDPRAALRKLCALDEAGERTLEMAVRRMGLTARAHDRILKVARTVADLDGSASVSAKHLAEAIQYRSLDRNYWS